MRRLFLLLDIFIVSQIAWAQCKLTVTVSFSGNCGGSLDARLQKAVSEQMAQHWNGMTFNSSTDCERAGLAARNDISGSYGGCTAHVTVLCGGCLKSSKAGNANMSGVGQGTSYYSTNVANEIQNWSEDDMERMLALNPEYRNEAPDRITTEDKDFNNARYSFIPINMRDEQGNLKKPKGYYFGEVLGPNDEKWKYYTEKEYLDELYLEYTSLTNINIKNIIYKLEKNDSDIKILADYQAWLKQKLAETAIFKDMAILCAVEYADGNQDLLESSKYHRITEAPDKEVVRLLKLVESCNDEPLNQGFHASVFYNEETKEYVVSFRGTEFPSKQEVIFEVIKNFNLMGYAKGFLSGALKNPNEPIKITGAAVTASLDNLITDLVEGNTDKLPPSFHDLSTDVSQAVGNVLTQYKMAVEIGEAIRSIIEENPNVKINITGHSMGGGEGIIAGLVSGQPTYVFNPAGVNDATYEYANVNEKVTTGSYNIHKIRTPDDQLSNFQESEENKWTYYRSMAKDLASKKGANPQTSIPKAIGKEYILKTDQGHSIEPIANILERRKLALEVFIKGGGEKNTKIFTE